MRPKLSNSLAYDDFLDYYWLKEELVVFCRNSSIPSGGAKKELAKRIATYLKNGKIIVTKKKKCAAKIMPAILTRQTVITPGFKCSQELRYFFEKEIGPKFHFNKVMRDFIGSRHGKTL